MTRHRRRTGDETWDRLLNWTKGQKAAERLAGHILKIESFESIDPSHPLGGRDGLKDLICVRNEKKFIGAAYFPNGKKSFREIKNKFSNDFKGIETNKVDGIVFITNQYLSNSERESLSKNNDDKTVEIYHLERLTNILNTPICYGIRLEYLDIELTKEEQLSFFASRDKTIFQYTEWLKELVRKYSNTPNIKKKIPIKDLEHFRSVLEYIVGNPSKLFSIYGSAPIDRLRIPLSELESFEKTLERIVGVSSVFSLSFGNAPVDKLRVPLKELESFKKTLEQVVGDPNPFSLSLRNAPVDKLRVPLNELKEYEEILNRILNKWEQIESIRSKIKYCPAHSETAEKDSRKELLLK